MTLTTVEAARQGNGEFADEAVIRNAEIAQLEGETDKVGDTVSQVNQSVSGYSAHGNLQIRSMDPAINKYGPVDIRVMSRRVDGRLQRH